MASDGDDSMQREDCSTSDENNNQESQSKSKDECKEWVCTCQKMINNNIAHNKRQLEELRIMKIKLGWDKEGGERKRGSNCHWDDSLRTGNVTSNHQIFAQIQEEFRIRDRKECWE